ncbi:MAG: beta-lactamase family protein [Verrucomicrobia bacterium]|nr:beta-lactamase family protein [Verrucomicrobiota bacterium]
MNPRLPLMLLLASLLAQARTDAAEAVRLPTTFDLPAIEAYLQSEVTQASRVGLSVVIVKDGRIVLARGFGRQSLTNPQPVEVTTRFAIGSVSKQFTCAAVLLLAEDGRLSVGDTVAKYYPDLTRAGDITLLDLMHHTSGYPDYYPLDFVDRRMQQPIAPDDLLRQYAGGKLDFEPGANWSYSNTGYILLGRVVERISGEPLGAFLQRRIFGPLGMTNTVYEPAHPVPQSAQGFTTFALSPPTPITPEGRGWLEGAGGIYSTPSDLARWDLALMEGQVLKPASYALMTTPRTLPNGRNTEYGCGVSVRLQQGREVVAHNGAVAGFTAFNAMVPSTRSALVMTCNLDGGLGALPGELLPLLMQEPAVVPVVEGPAAVDTVKAVFAGLQQGTVDRAALAPEFSHFLTGARLAGASERLGKFGSPTETTLLTRRERGGLEVTTTKLTFTNATLRVLMYRQPGGRIEQFFVDEE